MLPFEIIPKGRDLKAKYFYQIMRYYIKSHRKEIEAEIKKKLMDFYLYGIPIDDKQA